MNYKDFEEAMEKYKTIENLAKNASGILWWYNEIKNARKFINVYESSYELNFNDSDDVKDYVKDAKALCIKMNEQILKLLPMFEN